MCGIAGVISRDPIPLHRMEEALADLLKRGPDEKGIWQGSFDSPSGSWNVVIGIRRLIIRGKESGQQPFVSSPGEVSVINGEIYNYREFVDEGHGAGAAIALNARSDTATLAQALAHSYCDNLARIDGMFGLAHLSVGRRSLLLARDRFGQKPLYYSLLRDGGLAFASSPDAVGYLAFGNSSIDQDALRSYLLFECVPSPATIIRGIRKIPAGHMLNWQDGDHCLTPYFNVKTETTEPVEYRLAEIIEAIRIRLDESLRTMTEDLTSFALLLSSGIDSGLLASRLSKIRPGAVDCYTIAYPDARWCEVNGAARVASLLGLRHEAVHFSDGDLSGVMADLRDALVAPNGDPAFLPSLHICRHISARHRVVFTGDGADELFYGYPRYLMLPLCRLWDRIYPGLRRPLAQFFRAKDPIGGEWIRRLIRVTYNGLVADGGELFRQLGHVWRPAFLQHLAPELFTHAVSFASLPDRQPQWSDLYQTLPELLLAKADLAAMASSVENRAPFLANAVTSYARTLDDSVKCTGRQPKWPLRQFIRAELGANYGTERKQGFGLPLARWLRSTIREPVGDLLSSSDYAIEFGFEPTFVRWLFDTHQSRVADFATHVWSIYCLYLWRERFRTLHRGAE